MAAPASSNAEAKDGFMMMDQKIALIEFENLEKDVVVSLQCGIIVRLWVPL